MRIMNNNDDVMGDYNILSEKFAKMSHSPKNLMYTFTKEEEE